MIDHPQKPQKLHTAKNSGYTVSKLSVKRTVCIRYSFLTTTEVWKYLIRHHSMH